MTTEQAPIRINGKSYPLWSKFVQDLDWIGGELQDLDPESGGATTTIERIELKPNGFDSAWFEVSGPNWGCGSDAKYLGVVCNASKEDIDGGWIRFRGFGGHEWRIRRQQGFAA